MHRRPWSITGGRLFAAAITAAALGCSASGDGLTSLPCTTLEGGPCVWKDKDAADTGSESSINTGQTDSASSDSGVSRSPLCGVAGCYPGNPSACGAMPMVDAEAFAPPRDFAAELELDANGDVAYVDAASDASQAVSASDASRDGGVDNDGEIARDGAVDASIEGSPEASRDTGTTDEPKVPQSCYLKPSGGSVASECAPVGSGASGSACNDSSDCGASLACVEVNGKPVCRPFSCALPAECPVDNFYQLAPLRVSGLTLINANIPVCLPNDRCELLSTDNPCPTGQVCTVVGSGGETSCVTPGTAKLGDACDDARRCAGGLICSKLTSQCLRICHVGAGSTECPGGTCQGGNRSLPDPEHFGICVGETSDSGSP